MQLSHSQKDKYKKHVSVGNVGSLAEGDFNFVQWLKNEKHILFGFFFLVFGVYFNGINNGFVSDDIGSIVTNPYIKDFHTISQFNGIITTILYYLAYKVDGANPVVFRLLNIFFHFGSVILLYLFFHQKFSKSLGILVAIMFAVHPVLVESITWISGGPYTRYTFFFLLSFVIYTLYPKNPRNIILSAFFFVLSVFTSEKAVPLFLIFPLYDFIFGGKFRNVKNYLPYVFATGVFSLVFFGKIGERISGIQTDYYSQSTKYLNPLLQLPIAISEYFRLIFFPSSLTLYHSELNFSQGEYLVRLIFFLIFCGVFLFSYIKFRKKSFNWGFILFWLLFFIISLSVTLTPLGISWIVAERYVYLGSVGIFAIGGIIISKLAEKEGLKVFVYTVFSVAIVLFSARTIIRNGDWKNEDTLWIATEKTSPSSPTTHNNMGDVYSRKGDLDSAIKSFSKAIEINPRYADAYHNRGNAYQNKGDIENAIKDYEIAISINPNIWQSSQNLAFIYFEKGDFATSLKFMEISYSKNQNINSAFNLALIYSKVGKVKEARSLLINILSVDPANANANALLGQL